MTLDVLDAIRTRRMERQFLGTPVDPEAVRCLVDAATRAPAAANVGVRRVVVITSAAMRKTIRQVTPGLRADPPVLLALCTDLEQAGRQAGTHGRDISSWIDAGAAAENIALAALGLGLGACFARSCNDAALRVVLALPETVRPDILVGVGHAVASAARGVGRPRPVVYADRFGLPWNP
jgi:nitroreductase